MFVLELDEFPGYYHHKNSGNTTNDQWEGLYSVFDGYAREWTNVVANAKVHNTKDKAEKERKKIKNTFHGLGSLRCKVDINIVEVFIVSERELAENPMLQKAFDDFRLTQKLSAH